MSMNYHSHTSLIGYCKYCSSKLMVLKHLQRIDLLLQLAISRTRILKASLTRIHGITGLPLVCYHTSKEIPVQIFLWRSIRTHVSGTILCYRTSKLSLALEGIYGISKTEVSYSSQILQKAYNVMLMLIFLGDGIKLIQTMPLISCL